MPIYEDDPNYGDEFDHLFSSAGLPPLEDDQFLPDTESLNRAKRMAVTGRWEPHPHKLKLAQNARHHREYDEPDDELDLDYWGLWADREDDEDDLW